MTAAARATAQAAFVRACALDVAVRKPGNVSRASPGHGMHAGLFGASARAAAPALFAPGARLGDRIEAAVIASWAAAGCNTNLGIVLLCAPLALAWERVHETSLREAPAPTRAPSRAPLQRAIDEVLGELDVADARAAYRAIARANPGGLGATDAQDVRHAPDIDLRAAMALAADRDLIARQYRDGFADLFTRALPTLPSGFSLHPPAAPSGPDPSLDPSPDASLDAAPDAPTTAAIQHLYLTLLAAFPDSHIVRKHGAAVAQNVMTAAQGFQARAARGEPLDADPAFASWDEALKAQRINPGTTADLTVATLLIAGLAPS
jgi:triphosphoribosyl-dephospho-CoA synthase